MVDSFTKVDKQRWLSKVEADLKGRPIEELNFHLGQSELSPFFAKEDVDQIIKLPSQEDTVCLAFEHEVFESKLSNSIILEELKGGVGHLFLTFSKDWDGNFEALFQEIFLNMISISIVSIPDQFLQLLDSYIDNLNDNSVLENICIQGNGLVGLKSVFGQLRIISIPADGSIEKQLYHFLDQSYAELKKPANQDSYSVELQLGHQFYENVVLIRSIRLLWNNLVTALGHAQQCGRLKIKAALELSHFDKDRHTNMIALSQVAVSAISGGANYIVIPRSDANEVSDSESFTRRISRNIYHLLDMESHMTKVNDPANGSYFFDSQTTKQAEQAWNQFINEESHG